MIDIYTWIEVNSALFIIIFVAILLLFYHSLRHFVVTRKRKKPEQISTEFVLQKKDFFVVALKDIETEIVLKKGEYEKAKERYHQLIQYDAQLKSYIPLLEQQRDVLKQIIEHGKLP